MTSSLNEKHRLELQRLLTYVDAQLTAETAGPWMHIPFPVRISPEVGLALTQHYVSNGWEAVLRDNSVHRTQSRFPEILSLRRLDEG